LITYNILSKEERCIGKEGGIDYSFVATKGFLKNLTIATHTKYVAIHEGTSICIVSRENSAFCKRIVLSDNASVRGMQFDADTLVVLIKDSESTGAFLFYFIRDEKYERLDLPFSLKEGILDEGIRTEFFIMPEHIFLFDSLGKGYFLDKKKGGYVREVSQRLFIDPSLMCVACLENEIVVTYQDVMFPNLYRIACIGTVPNSIKIARRTRWLDLDAMCGDDNVKLIDTCIVSDNVFFLMYSFEKLYVLINQHDSRDCKKIDLSVEGDQGLNWTFVVTSNNVYIVETSSLKDDRTVWTLDFTGEPIVSRVKKNRAPFSVLEDGITDGLDTITKKIRLICLTVRPQKVIAR